MRFDICKYHFEIKIAPKNTIWWYALPETHDIPQQRIDSLITLERIFIRAHCIYIYEIRIGRLSLQWVNSSQKLRKPL